jgi:hypothetical protein
MLVDSFFLAHGITFTQVVTNPGGIGELTLIAGAVPEAGAFLLFGTVGLATLVIRQRGRHGRGRTRLATAKNSGNLKTQRRLRHADN